MEPDIVCRGLLQAEAVVLAVVAADEHGKALCRDKAAGRQGRRFGRRFGCGFSRRLAVLFVCGGITGGCHFPPRLRQLLFGFGKQQGLPDGTGVGQLFPVGRELLRDLLPRLAGLGVASVTALHVLLGRESRVQLHPDQLPGVVEGGEQDLLRAFFQLPQIGGQQVPFGLE